VHREVLTLTAIRSPAQLRAAYVGAFDLYTSEPSEAALNVAYELGRRAVELSVSVPEIARIHHAALDAALETSSSQPTILLACGADFLAECLSAFEMVRRGYAEAHDRIVRQGRDARLLRHLSALLTDVSLADGGSPSALETLRLVAEAARELTGARCCVATLDSSEKEDEPVTVASGTIAPGEPVTTLNADINELGGRTMGSLVLVAERGRSFSSADHATLEHLAQMTGAAVERSRLYA
jgi:GAF domain-containing protein